MISSIVGLIDYYEEKQHTINREMFCQDCEAGIYIKNCKNCLFLCAYEIPDTQDCTDL